MHKMELIFDDILFLHGLGKCNFIKFFLKE